MGDKISRPGDVVFTSKGTVGRFAFVRPETPRFVYSPQLSYWRSLNQDFIDSRFLYYWLQSREFLEQAAGVKGQTDMADYVSLKDQRFMKITLPHVDIQRAIACILGALDDKIELNRRMNITLEAMAQSLFKSWFVDFDPVVVKMDGKKPYGMNEATAALFPDKLVESQVGLMPEGWDLRRLDEVCSINPQTISNGYALNHIQYVDISSVTRGILTQTTPYSLKEAPSRAQRLVSDGDTIWSCVRPNRQSYLFIDHPPEDLVVSTGFAVLSPTDVQPVYLYTWVTTDDFVDYLTANAEGSAYPAVRPEAFAKALVLVPTKQILNHFEVQINPMRRLIAQNNRETVALQSVRGTLLPKLLSGEVSVKEV
ncbi:MAG: restriction endonuclease subunit S [Ignavibacteriales bacterium]|nr:restriction endonuclease subunit S [Ignavibacteriales bacterium]